MIVKEIRAKTILSESKVFKYTVNPYVGCEHGCTYCYARFMKRFTGHKEKWGTFVDVKTNAANLLQREIRRRQPRRVWVSGVCDPYQPLEKEYETTRKCLKTLLEHGWPVTVQTKSPLVNRDVELLKESGGVEVGLSIATGDENIKKIFEPNSPSIKTRVETLGKLHSAGVKTFAMIAPLLPKTEELAKQLTDKVDYVLVDKMNYHHADWVYRKFKLEHAMTKTFFNEKKNMLAQAFKQEGTPCKMLF